MPEMLPNYSFWADVPFLVKVQIPNTLHHAKCKCSCLHLKEGVIILIIVKYVCK